MSARYFDTTYLCKLRWPEAGSAEVAACAAQASELVCSLHGRAEFYSIGHRKIREGVTTPASLAAVFRQFDADCAGGRIVFCP